MKNKFIKENQLNKLKKWEAKLKDRSQNKIPINNLSRSYKVI